MLEYLGNNGLALVLLVLPLAIIAHNLLGAALAGLSFKEHFDAELLKKGLVKGVLVYSGILIYALISYFMKDLLVNVGGNVYSLMDAMYVIVLAAIAKFSKDGIEKLMEIMKYKTTEEE